MRLKSKAILIFGLIVVLTSGLIEGLWLTLGQNYLRGPKFLALINQPDLQISFAEIHSPYPGYLRLKNLKLQAIQEELSWNIDFESTELRLRLLPLLWREVSLAFLHGQSGSLTFREKLHGEAEKTEAEEAAPDGAGKQADAETGDKPWSIAINSIKIDDLSELIVQDLRFAGKSHATGDLIIDKQNRLTLPQALFVVEDAEVFQKDRSIGRVLKTSAKIAMEPFDTSGPAKEMLKKSKVELSIDAQLTDLGFVFRWLAPVDWLKLGGEGGRAQGSVRMEHDEFIWGSKLRISTGKTRAEFLGQQVTGVGSNVWEVTEEGKVRVLVVFEEYALKRVLQKENEVNGKGLTVSIESPQRRVTEAFDQWQADIMVPPAQINNLSYLNAFVPVGSGLKVIGGQGSLRGHIRAHSDSKLPSGGELHFESRNFAVRYDKVLFDGDMRTTVKFSKVDIKQSLFDLENSKIVLERVKSRVGDTVDNQNWAGTVAIPKAQIKVEKPMRFDGNLILQSKDLRPVIAIFTSQSALPSWIKNALNLRQFNLSLEAHADEKNLILRDLVITAEKLKIEGWFNRLNNQAKGKLLLDYQGTVAGLGVNGESYEFKLLGAKNWFAKSKSQL